MEESSAPAQRASQGPPACEGDGAPAGGGRDHLAQLIEAAGDVIVTVNPDLRITFWNRAAGALYGRDAGSMLGQSVLTLWGKRTREARDLHARVLAGETLHDLTLTWRKQDGTRSTLLFSLSPIRDAAGAIVGILGVGRDITRQQLIERALRRHNQQLLALQRIGAAVSATLSPQKLFQLIVEHALEILDGKFSLLRLLTPNGKFLALVAGIGSMARLVRHVPAQGSFAEETFQSRRGLCLSSGEAQRRARPPYQRILEQWPHHVLVAPLLLGEEALGSIYVGRGVEQPPFDDTDLALLELLSTQAAIAIRNAREHAQLEQTETRYRELYDKAPDLYHTVDAQGIILSCNETYANALGYAKEELIGASYFDLLLPEERDEARRGVAKTFEGGTASTSERTFVRKDGSLLPLEINVRLMPDAAGGMSYSYTLLRDISERKRVEIEARLLQNLTQAIAACDGFEEALAVSLRGICEVTGWSYGDAWVPRADQSVLERSPANFVSAPRFERFREESLGMTFPPGKGVPGRVWASRQAEIVESNRDLSDAENPRLPLARELGLAAAVGIPIIAENDVLAVLMFAMREFQPEDRRKIDLVCAVATQLSALVLRKWAESALRESEERSRQIFDTALDAIVTTDERAIIESMNPAAERIFGYAAAEALGKNVISLLLGEAQQATEVAALNEYLRGGKPPILGKVRLVEGKRRNGETFPMELAITEMRVNGERKFVGIGRDVSERNAAEEALQAALAELAAAEARYRDLYDLSPDLYHSLDAEGVILNCNETYARTLGYRKEELIGRCFFDFLPPAEERPGAWEAFRQNVARRRPGAEEMGRLERTLLRRDGSPLATEVSYRNFYDAEGRFAHSNTVLRDITERTRAEAALRQAHAQLAEAEARYRDLYDHAPDMYHSLDANGMILTCNETYARTLGYTKAELIGRCFFDLVSAEERQEASQLFHRNSSLQLRDQEATGRDERMLIRRDGSRLASEINFRNLYDAEGRFICSNTVLRDITERKRAEAALRQAHEQLEKAEARYRDLYDHAPDMYLSLDRRGVIEAANTTLAETLGYSREEILGSKLLTYLQPEHRDAALRYFRRLLDGTGALETESLLLRRDGSCVPVEVRVRLVLGEAGKAARIDMMIRDVTKRKEAEEALQTALRELTKAEASYRDLYDHAPDMLHSLDDQGRIVNCNQTFCGAVGYAKEELIGRSYLDFLPPGQRELSFNTFQYNITHGIVGSDPERLLERTFLRRDGSTFEVELRFRNDFDGHGKFLRSDTILRDISTRKEAERDRQRLATAIECAAESVTITDPAGIIFYVNPEFERTTGYSRQEAIGQHSRILKSFNHDRSFYENLWQTITRGNVWAGRFINRRKDGAIYFDQATISPVFASDGTITNFVKVARDVTREVELQAQLRHADKLASIGTLAAGAAHEILNPSNIISMFAQLLQKKRADDDEVASTAETIIKQVKRIENICDSLRRFSRSGTGERATFDLNELIEETLQLLGPDLRQQEVAVVRQLDPELPKLTANRDEIAQVLLNLCTNAMDAMPAAGTLTLRTESLRGEDRSLLRLAVEDTGHGMSEEVLKRIFDPFFTTKPQDYGTGLGLSITYGIIEAHRGTIQVVSKPEKGTVFTIEIPTGEESRELSPQPHFADTLREFQNLKTDAAQLYQQRLQQSDAQRPFQLCWRALHRCASTQLLMLQRLERWAKLASFSLPADELENLSPQLGEMVARARAAQEDMRSASGQDVALLRLAYELEVQTNEMCSAVANLFRHRMPEFHAHVARALCSQLELLAEMLPRYLD
ncbi:MAG: PAS domain S-box protein [Candidatus Tectomicrobia bacterium]|nr:PAS domain S-box protein [Candidatus Tectomicrobia bacterium]